MTLLPSSMKLLMPFPKKTPAILFSPSPYDSFEQELEDSLVSEEESFWSFPQSDDESWSLSDRFSYESAF